VLFSPKDLARRRLLGELAYNDRLRAQILAGQRRRLDEFGDTRIAASIRDMLGVFA
jgi:hypothetical protein